jgi:uncharacterized protein YyaL (SSP411 family)
LKNCAGFFAIALLLSWPQLLVAQVAPLPGLPATELARTARLYAIYQQKVGSYTVHTQHLNADGSPKYVNALITEDSPYLKQHVHNPVNWFPWSEEAFSRAEAENKPIFLSIGYSTCHWCHVMARESFDDEHIAQILNRHFISIKVDREQHPDIDEIYMTGVQLISGRGGWPMSSFLTPEGKPFFGATYYPPQQFTQLLLQVEKVWRSSEERLRQDANSINEQINRLLAISEAAEISPGILEQAVEVALENYDATDGGFTAAPKFPNETLLLLILDQLRRADNAPLQAAFEHTLHKMAQGGLYDQVGGGFHRYSVDSHWLVPHFEKMLYNQALLARVYSEAYQFTGEAFYGYVLRETLDYVLRDMRDANGCFYSATDADSEEEEGLFFVWTPQQLESVLSESDAEWLASIYGVTEQGNFESSNILHLRHSYEEIAAREQLPATQVYQRIEKIRQQLYQHREQRIHPLRDEKVITAWSAMMTTAMTQGAVALSEKRYLQAAEQCAQYLYRHHWNEQDKQLWRIGWQGEASVAAAQEDYAYFIEALITLFDATADKQWLTRAQRLTDQMIAVFWDSRQGGFFASTESTATPTIVRMKSTGDGAIPSGNSVALRILDQLWSRTGELRYREHFTQTLAAVAEGLNRYPLSATYTLIAISNHQAGEAGQLVYFADGHIVVRLLRGDKKSGFTLQLAIDEGWHINADQVLQKELIPTSVSTAGRGWHLDQLVFPQAEEIRFDFQAQPLRVLHGQTTILGLASRRGDSTAPLRLLLTLQACDNSHCLAPQTRTLVLRM